MTFRDDNGNELQIESQFAMTKQAVSFFNGSIRGDVSSTFQVDNNSVNRKVLGYSGPQMTGQVAWTKQAFNRVRNGNILDRGYIVIQSDNDDSLSCFYVSGNSNWVQMLNGLITQLNLDSYYKPFDNSQVLTASTGQSGICFPFVDWGYDLKKGIGNYHTSRESSPIVDTTNDVQKQLIDFYPSFYLSSLVDEITTQNGLKITGNFKDDAIYKSLAITPVNGLMKRKPFKDVNALGTSQNFLVSASAQRYTSFNETSDPDQLFANSTYSSNRVNCIVVTIYVAAQSATFSQLSLFKNGVAIENKAGTNALQTYQFLRVPVLPGDTLDIYVANTSGGAKDITLNVKFESVENIFAPDYHVPTYFLPPLTSLEIIKYIINFFGCSVSFNEYSKTINCNIIEKIKNEDAYDWSQYFISSTADYTVNQAQNNYIRWAQNQTDSSVKNYNSSHIVEFGEGNIETDNTLKKDNELIKLPFVASSSGLNNKIGIFSANIPLVNLKDNGDPIDFSAITDSGGGTGQCTFTVVDSSVFHDGEVVRISNSSSASLGYFVVINKPTATTVAIRFTFYATDTGKIFKQEFAYQNVGPRIISVKPNTNIADFSTLSSVNIMSNPTTITSAITSIDYAAFTKQITGDTIDQWKNNLAIDNPDSGGFTDPTIKELYFNKISRFLNNPNIKARFILPEAVYQRFQFDQFIYLKTERLTGYFFVDSIVNYVDGNTPCEINLYML